MSAAKIHGIVESTDGAKWIEAAWDSENEQPADNKRNQEIKLTSISSNESC